MNEATPPPVPTSPPNLAAPAQVYIAQPTRPNSNMALVSLIAGLLSWLALPVIGAVVAIITGHVARSEIRRSEGALDGDGLALAGLILGYAQIAMCLLVIAAFVLFLGGLAAIFGMLQ